MPPAVGYATNSTQTHTWDGGEKDLVSLTFNTVVGDILIDGTVGYEETNITTGYAGGPRLRLYIDDVRVKDAVVGSDVNPITGGSSKVTALMRQLPIMHLATGLSPGNHEIDLRILTPSIGQANMDALAPTIRVMESRR